MRVRYCGNSHDPRLQNADMYVARGFYSQPGEDVARWYQWLDGKVIGPPEATEAYTREQLTEMGMISVWMINGPDDGLTKMAEIELGTEYTVYHAPAYKTTRL